MVKGFISFSYSIRMLDQVPELPCWPGKRVILNTVLKSFEDKN